MIHGPNGCGKSSLFRILGDLWPILGGVLKKPYHNIFYIPQKPYLPGGTLRDQIIYPHSYKQFLENNGKDENLIDLLKYFNVEYLATRSPNGLNEKMKWSDTLATGEKQILAMTRLYYHCPKYAILDECSSSVSFEIEEKMYKKAKDMNITLITVSHRDSVWQYHDYLLRFKDRSTFSFEKFTVKKIE
jgi:ABC-type uncharacterized transport system fused permease/ATPase subunit